MLRIVYLTMGLVALALGTVGAFLPLLPTVPFYILAAFCFARSSPALEQRLLNHPQFGVHLRNWRDRGAISKKGKTAALIAFGLSAGLGLAFVKLPWGLMPAVAAMVGSTWIWTRPEP